MLIKEEFCTNGWADLGIMLLDNNSQITRVCVREQGFDEHILRSWGERQFSFREQGTKPPSPNPVGSKWGICFRGVVFTSKNHS